MALIQFHNVKLKVLLGSMGNETFFVWAVYGKVHFADHVYRELKLPYFIGNKKYEP